MLFFSAMQQTVGRLQVNFFETSMSVHKNSCQKDFYQQIHFVHPNFCPDYKNSEGDRTPIIVTYQGKISFLGCIVKILLFLTQTPHPS